MEDRTVKAFVRRFEIDSEAAGLLVAAGVTSAKAFRELDGDSAEQITKGALTKEQHASIVSNLLAKEPRKDK